MAQLMVLKIHFFCQRNISSANSNFMTMTSPDILRNCSLCIQKWVKFQTWGANKIFISVKPSYFHCLSHSLYHGAKIVFKMLFLILDDVIRFEFGECLRNVSIWKFHSWCFALSKFAENEQIAWEKVYVHRKTKRFFFPLFFYFLHVTQTERPVFISFQKTFR